MLTRTATRRSAAVLMVALVAMLLVATGGSARAVQARVSIGTGHVSATPHAGRQAAAIPPVAHEHVPQHLDLATTPPVDPATVVDLVDDRTADHEPAHTPVSAVTPVGRAPPAP